MPLGVLSVRRAGQPERGRAPPRFVRTGVERGICRAAHALRIGGRSGPGTQPRPQGHGGERDPAHPRDDIEGAPIRIPRRTDRVAGARGRVLGGTRIHGRKKRQVLEMYQEE